MLDITAIQQPSLLFEKDGQIKLLKGEFKRLENLTELEVLHSSHPNKIVFITPFCVARENGMETLGDEDILAIKVEEEVDISSDQLAQLTADSDIQFNKKIIPSITDDAFAAEVRKIQKKEISAGNASQVVYSRRFEGLVSRMSPMIPLVLFKRLLKQQGAYITFLFSDGKGGYFVGASPERQLEINKGKAIKNPIAGTMPKGDKKDFQERLDLFLKDKKEINELSQILDEELKIMSQICPKGGKILGPFIRESGAVIHTEYKLVGHSHKSAIESLKASFHAPTLVGSPLKSAFRIIAKREKYSRRYYGGEIGILEENGDMDSAILIRTSEFFDDGRVVIQAGAGIVRDSDPKKEAQETSAKAGGLISALEGDTFASESFITPKILDDMNTDLLKRNKTFSSFHFEDQMNVVCNLNAKDYKITIINNEDNFAYILAHIIHHMGYQTKVVDTFEFCPDNDTSDIVIIGPGPGDINDIFNKRMNRLLMVTKQLINKKKPIFGICLGIQAISRAIGIPVKKQNIPTQGLQEEIDFFGSLEKVGLYNSFSPVDQNVPSDIKISTNKNGRIMAMKRKNLFGIQFHVESIMTQNGYAILQNILNDFTPLKKGNLNLETFIEKTMKGNIDIEDQKEFLLDLNNKGFTAEDVAYLVKFFHEQMPNKLNMPDAVDICGTGGSGLPRINTSTISAFVLSGCGVPVAKHGNKAASGRFGSFDLLESLGVNIMADKNKLESIYKSLGLAFIYARSFHPVFRHFAKVRQEIGSKTIFNILGPLLNPANPQIQIIGTSNKADMKLIVETAKLLGKKKVLVLNGSDGLDELTLTGETEIMELNNGEIKSYTLKPEDFGFKTVSFKNIKGGNRKFNTEITHQILNGTCKTDHLNLVLVNTALILKFIGKVSSYSEGVRMARETIESGKTIELLNDYNQISNVPDVLMKIVENKRLEIEKLKKILPLEKVFNSLSKSDRNFKTAISKKGSLNLIAEIKKGSPLAGKIYSGSKSVAQIAKLYEENNADAISVLTDEKYFNGSLENLKIAHSATSNIPILMKDFIVDEYQIYLARYFGANAILLITSILAKDQIDWFISIARALNMDVLLEVHNEQELDMALQSKADLIGINNRNLHTFEIDTKNFLKLYPSIPDSKIIVAESGYNNSNTSIIHGMANAVLVGTSIMQSSDMADEIKQIKTFKRKFKPCGVRTVQTAKCCEEKKVELMGLNFVPTSKRCVDVKTAKSIVANLKNSSSVGVFQNHPIDEVNRIAKEVGLDFVQLSGSEGIEYCKKIKCPIIKTITTKQYDQIPMYSNVVCMFILDGNKPGSGLAYDYSALKHIKINKPFLIAGGIDQNSVVSILSDLPLAYGVDVATGIETDGLVDIVKIDNIVLELERFCKGLQR